MGRPDLVGPGHSKPRPSFLSTYLLYSVAQNYLLLALNLATLACWEVGWWQPSSLAAFPGSAPTTAVKKGPSQQGSRNNGRPRLQRPAMALWVGDWDT